MVFSTEIGFNERKEVIFINAYSNFVPITSKLVEPKLLMSVIHDEEGNISNISVIDATTVTEIANYDKAACIKAAKEMSQSYFSALEADFKLGTIIQFREFLVGLWEKIKPIALEKIA